MDDAEKKLWREFLGACSTVRDIDGDSWGTITFEDFKIAIARNTAREGPE